MAFPTGWLSKCALVIQHAQVTANQTAFPVLLTAACFATNCPEILTSGNAHAAQSDGGDLRFSTDSAGASQIACEVAAWIPNATFASAVAAVWVPANILTASDVTLYVWWEAGGGLSQPAASAPFGSQAVWDANYLVVRHLGNGTTLNVNGSAASEPAGTNHGATATTSAAFGPGSATFNGTSQYIDTGYTPASVTNFTLQCWLFWPVSGNTSFPISARDATGNNGIGILMEGAGNGGEILFSNAGSLTRKKWGNGFATGQWHCIAGTHASGATTCTLVVNGVVGGTQTESAASNPGNGTALLIAKESALFFATVSGGAVQEVRLSNIVRATSWFITEYNNQASPGTFAIAGARTAGGGGGSAATQTFVIT